MQAQAVGARAAATKAPARLARRRTRPPRLPTRRRPAAPDGSADIHTYPPCSSSQTPYASWRSLPPPPALLIPTPRRVGVLQDPESRDPRNCSQQRSSDACALLNGQDEQAIELRSGRSRETDQCLFAAREPHLALMRRPLRACLGTTVGETQNVFLPMLSAPCLYALLPAGSDVPSPGHGSQVERPEPGEVEAPAAPARRRVRRTGRRARLILSPERQAR